MRFEQAVFWLSTVPALQLTHASPASVALVPRQDLLVNGTALPLVSFADEFVLYTQPGEIIKDCDPLPDGCNSKRDLNPRQSRSVCPEETIYGSSICTTWDTVYTRCYKIGSNRRYDIWTTCPKHTICIQRGSFFEMRRARCISIVDLVTWYTPPDPAVEGSKKVAAQDSGSVSGVTNNFYDAKGTSIIVFDTLFTGQPGDIYLGDVRYSDTPESYAISWARTPSVDIAVKAGNVGGLKVVSFLSFVDP